MDGDRFGDIASGVEGYQCSRRAISHPLGDYTSDTGQWDGAARLHADIGGRCSSFGCGSDIIFGNSSTWARSGFNSIEINVQFSCGDGVLEE